ncbi:MAG TPA: O-antigen ligase family protein [Bryobacteraceae bacterium]|nr:O-antigen ligase family protein [Bryobacteraceae bacterium]
MSVFKQGPSKAIRRPGTLTAEVPKPAAQAGPQPAAMAFRPQLPPISSQGLFGFYSLLFFLFLLYSRVCDLFLPWLHIPLASSTISAIMAILSGGLLAALNLRVSKFLLLYTVWLTITIPFSVWRGGSFQVVTSDWYRAVLAYFLVVVLVQTLDEVTRAIRVVTYALGVLAFLAMAFGKQTDGRLLMPVGYFSNPNELGMAMLAGVFLWWAMSRDASRSMALRAFAAVLIPVMVWILLRTGSRSGLLSVAFCAPFLLREYSPAGRIKILIGGALLAVIAAMALPGLLLERFGTFFSAQEKGATAAEAAQDERTIGSSEQRMYLLRTSLMMTVENPIFGVGPGNFAVVDASQSEERHEHPGWAGTHNTYTQISSEAGVPALVFFVAALVIAWRGLARARRLNRAANHPRKRQMDMACAGLQLTVALFAFQFLFIHMAYSAVYPAIAGLSVALVRAVERELAVLKARSIATAPAAGARPLIANLAIPVSKA